jgi:hypothetical protein
MFDTWTIKNLLYGQSQHRLAKSKAFIPVFGWQVTPPMRVGTTDIRIVRFIKPQKQKYFPIYRFGY